MLLVQKNGEKVGTSSEKVDGDWCIVFDVRPYANLPDLGAVIAMYFEFGGGTWLGENNKIVGY